MKTNKCQICGKEGKIAHFPGPVPYSGSWCKDHYQELKIESDILVRQSEELYENSFKNADDVNEYIWIVLKESNGCWVEEKEYKDRCWAIGNTASAIVQSGQKRILKLKHAHRTLTYSL